MKNIKKEKEINEKFEKYKKYLNFFPSNINKEEEKYYNNFDSTEPIEDMDIYECEICEGFNFTKSNESGNVICVHCGNINKQL
ncbi:hypothetical protein tloyanaT_21070 [Thalassotalea loyana]|uniref:Uncharacterized protein n=1 Tax=Thalassotalea loyana TaxID=280483 RepID=A0ABQ6HGI8_9GAMM|nr:hypothetical protein [Thalassotalea loyana]GLX85855.1 hypothetical protein tloyanaT_21070 [Thalassotalea loyana]